MKKFTLVIFLILSLVTLALHRVYGQETSQPSAAIVVSQTNSVESQSGPITNASLRFVKAYKTLNFGDDADTVEKMLGGILVNEPRVRYEGEMDPSGDEDFWKALFNNDAEYEPYKFNGNSMTEQSKEFNSLRDSFGKLDLIEGRNSAIYVKCFLLNGTLAVVEVFYPTNDLDNLIAGFKQNYPNAQKETRHHKIELLPAFPGVFADTDETLFSDISQERKAELSFRAGKATVTFTEKSELSESDKNSLLEKVSKSPTVVIATFVSKQILDPLINNYRRSIEAANQAQKAQLKKESDASSGF